MGCYSLLLQRPLCWDCAEKGEITGLDLVNQKDASQCYLLTAGNLQELPALTFTPVAFAGSTNAGGKVTAFLRKHVEKFSSQLLSEKGTSLDAELGPFSFPTLLWLRWRLRTTPHAEPFPHPAPSPRP